MAIGVFLVAMDLTIVVSCTNGVFPIFPMFKEDFVLQHMPQ